MKKLFRFTAVAVVAFALCMAVPSCSLINDGHDELEQGGDNNDDDDGDNVGMAPAVQWFEFSGEWEAYEWLNDDPYKSEEELELMQQQTCVVSIYGGGGTREGYGDYDANLLCTDAYVGAPSDYVYGRTRTDWFFERETYSFTFTVEEYTDDDWYVLMLTFDDEKPREPCWNIKIDSKDRNKAEFWFDGYGHRKALMRRI